MSGWWRRTRRTYRLCPYPYTSVNNSNNAGGPRTLRRSSTSPGRRRCLSSSSAPPRPHRRGVPQGPSYGEVDPVVDLGKPEPSAPRARVLLGVFPDGPAHDFHGLPRQYGTDWAAPREKLLGCQSAAAHEKLMLRPQNEHIVEWPSNRCRDRGQLVCQLLDRPVVKNTTLRYLLIGRVISRKANGRCAGRGPRRRMGRWRTP